MIARLTLAIILAGSIVACDGGEPDVTDEARGGLSDIVIGDGEGDGDDGDGEADDGGGDDGGGDGGTCEEEVCFDVTAEKDISFIAVLVATCDGGDATLSLSTPDGEPVAIAPEEHGNGTSCEGVDGAALKFEGLSVSHYVLCVSGGGLASVEITTKAGTGCEVTVLAGDCEACGEGGGTSSSSGAGGDDGGGDDGGGDGGDGEGAGASGTPIP